MQPEFLQRGRVAAFEDLDRILLLGDWQQRREVPDVLLELVEDRRDPALPEPDPRPDPLRLEFLRSGVRGLLEQRDPGLAPQFLAEEERGVRAKRQLDTGDALGGVPVVGVGLRTDLQVELNAGARRLRRDCVGVRRQPFGTVDRDVQILPTGGEDLLVEEGVPGVGTDRLGAEMLPREGRQDPDHGDVRAGLPRLLLRVVKTRPQICLEVRLRVTGQPARLDVDLDVELTQLGLEILIRDRLQYVGVAHRRVMLLVDEVELDLQPGHWPLGVELRGLEHPGEDVQAAPDLRSVQLPVLPAELATGDLITHR